jgi:hypothetical protein
MKLTTLGRTLAATALLAASLAAGAAPQDRIVFQVSDNNEATWNQAMNNAANVRKTLGADKVAVEIVVFGQGIGMTKFDSPVADRVAKTVAGGVDIVVCENTMTAQKLTKQDMNDKVSYVPAGVVEIMNKQKAGWIYIKP